jgi:hypothetical protein
MTSLDAKDMRRMAHAAHDESTVPLRVAAAVLLCFASLAGVAPPLVYRAAALDGHSTLATQLKAFGSGVVLSLALLHLVSDSFARLSPLAEFPWAAAAVACGMLFMFAVETFPTLLLAPPRPKGNGGSHSKGNGGDAVELVEAVCIDSGAAAAAQTHHAHSHGALLLQATTSSRQVTAYMLEASVLCHSLIIGADLGVSTESNSKVAGLTAVLAVHQFCEGLSLGAVIADAGAAIPPRKKVIFALAFCCTTSIGVLVGLLITASSGPLAQQTGGASHLGDVVAGALDGFTGGMLLHMSFGPLIADDFARPETSTRAKLQMFGYMCGGCLLMAGLAVWA